MSTFPEILIGHDVTASILAAEGLGQVVVESPGRMEPIPASPMEMLAQMGSGAYGVKCVALQHGVNVCSVGKFGISDEKYRMVEYPVSFRDASDEVFRNRLSEALVPVVREELARVEALREADRRAAS